MTRSLQVLAQSLLHVAGEREPKVGVKRALVEFVEQHRADALQHRVVEHEPRENALGDDLDAGLARNFRAKAHPQADRLADAFAERIRHALCRGARGKPARLQHQDAPAFGPGFFGENQRHARRLAGAGWRDQNGGVARTQRFGEFRQRGVDRKRRKFHSPLLIARASLVTQEMQDGEIELLRDPAGTRSD